MKIEITTIDDFCIVDITGVVDSLAAGQLYDVLVDAVGDGWKKLIVEFSAVTHVTRAGIRGVIVAAKLAKRQGGELRICGPRQSVMEDIRGFGFSHLLKCDVTIEMSIIALAMGNDPAAMPVKRPVAANSSWEIRPAA